MTGYKQILASMFVALAALVAGCADNSVTHNPTDGSRTLGASCVEDADCADESAYCDRRVCALPETECSENSDCLSFEICDAGGVCNDMCVLMDCMEGHTCERGTCIPNENACQDLMDCGAYEVCESGTCVSNGDCEPWFVGAFINAEGVCEEGGKSGCNNPFTWTTVEACEEALDSGRIIDSCPEDSDVFFGNDDRPVAATDLRCEYGTECCCGDCHPSLVCQATAGDLFSCYNTDACMIPGCGCESDADCQSGEICNGDGFCEQPSTCTAYWTGVSYTGTACLEGSTSGCSDPFPYDTMDACCADHGGAQGCNSNSECVTLEDCGSKEYCDGGTCVYNGACEAYFEGAYLDTEGTCRDGALSGCSNPFDYDSVETCCEENSDANGCGENTCGDLEDCGSYEFCREGVCVHNGDCDAYFEGAYLDEAGKCREGGVSGCENPFPYTDEAACCDANLGACGVTDEETECVTAGGDWELFSNGCADRCGNEGMTCTEAFTMGCDCGPDACWNGRACGTEACTADNECADGEVCESTADGAECVRGCRDDGDCTAGEVCTDVECVTTPCPDICVPEELPTNCGAHTCAADTEYCFVGHGGAPPEEGESNTTYDCRELEASCAAEADRCDCVGPEAGGTCSTDASGLTRVEMYYP